MTIERHISLNSIKQLNISGLGAAIIKKFSSMLGKSHYNYEIMSDRNYTIESFAILFFNLKCIMYYNTIKSFGCNAVGN